MAKWLSSRDKKAVAWVGGVWAAFVIVVAFRQVDGMGALFLGLAQEALLLGVALLILCIAPRRKSPAGGTHER
jgi:hypothetical protein